MKKPRCEPGLFAWVGPRIEALSEESAARTAGPIVLFLAENVGFEPTKALQGTKGLSPLAGERNQPTLPILRFAASLQPTAHAVGTAPAEDRVLCYIPQTAAPFLSS